MKYSGLKQTNDNYEAAPPAKETLRPLPSGTYRLGFNEMTGQVVFVKMTTNYDKLLNLPDAAYDRVIKEMEQFLLPETKSLFAQYDYIYKRNTLLYGPPGTGKTCIVNRVAEHVAKSDGIVLFNPHPKLLAMAFEFLDEIQPDTITMVIFEEMDELIDSMGEKDFLNMLDGETQKDNVIFVATTNYIEKINPRIYRPGRFASVIEVGFPSYEARRFYLQTKMPTENPVVLTDWAEDTNGLSIDELKETVLAVKCLNQLLPEVVLKIKNLKAVISRMHDEEDEDKENIYEGILNGTQLNRLNQMTETSSKKAKRR